MTAGRISWKWTWTAYPHDRGSNLVEVDLDVIAKHPIMTANQFTRIVTTPGLTESMRPSNTE